MFLGRYDPLENVTRDLQHLIIGGEAALWTEQTDEHNLDAKVWPRAAAAAEVFWSGSARKSGLINDSNNGKSAYVAFCTLQEPMKAAHGSECMRYGADW